MKTPRERYQNDNNFRVLVDTMVANIHRCNYTPSEMREAALLACIIYDEQKVRTITVPKFSEGVEEALKVIESFTNSQPQD